MARQCMFEQNEAHRGVESHQDFRCVPSFQRNRTAVTHKPGTQCRGAKWLGPLTLIIVGSLAPQASLAAVSGFLPIPTGQLPIGQGDSLDTYRDRDVLEILYHSTDGANWYNSDGWLDGEDPGFHARDHTCVGANWTEYIWEGCYEHFLALAWSGQHELDVPYGQCLSTFPAEEESPPPAVCWYGVESHHGLVREITLPENNLRGTIPPELGLLSELRFLNLSFNGRLGA